MNNFDPALLAEEDEIVHMPIHASDKSHFSKHQVNETSGKYRLPFLLNLLKFADVAVLLTVGFGGHYLMFGTEAKLTSSNHLFIYLSTELTIVALHTVRAYPLREMPALHSSLNRLLAGATAALLMILIVGFLSGALQLQSRAWVIASAMSSLVLLMLNRVVISQFLRSTSRSGMFTESIVVVGANEHAELMIDALRTARNSNIKVCGVFDDRVQRELPASLLPQMLGSTDFLLNYIRKNRVDRVVVTLPWVASDRIEALLKKLRTVPVRIDLVPNNVVWSFPTINMERLGTVPVLTVANGRVDKQIGMIKRAEDLIISILMLILLSPLMLLIALTIKVDSKGPAIFKQRRHGFNNRVFEVYKFRTMTVADSASVEVVQATRNDKRVTRIGKFLRKSSLDELPQLLNVLLGHMSFVGPRPHAVQHNIEFGAIISEYYARHNVKPGITGWAQVSGLRGETDTVDKMHRRVQYDLHYIEHWSVLLDIKIIVMTALVVWFQDDAF